METSKRLFNYHEPPVNSEEDVRKKRELVSDLLQAIDATSVIADLNALSKFLKLASRSTKGLEDLISPSVSIH